MHARRLAAAGTILALAAGLFAAAAPQPSGAVASRQPTGQPLALTPPMGWNGFNHFTRDVTASIAESEARALVSSGMKADGYDYVNLDGGWDLLQRDADGNLQPDPAKFPDGIKPVADYVHSLGLKFGIYTALGTTNCAGTSAGSWQHYQQDVDTFASWGVDYVKVDWCAVPTSQFPGQTDEQIAQQLYTQFGQAIARAGRPMVYSLSTNTPALQAWTWAPQVGNLWRTSGDLADSYSGMISNFTQNVQHSQDAGPGGWNDPDMLQVGNGGMTATEDQTEFSLWAEMAAPLIAGNDLTAMSAATKSVLTNREVIAVDQDRLGKQAQVVSSANGLWVLTKPLAGGSRAVVLFNQGDTPAVISTTAAAAGLEPARGYVLRDLWRHSTAETTGPIAAAVPPHGAMMYRVSAQPGAAGHAPPQTVLAQSSASAVAAAGGTTTVTATLTDNGAVALRQVQLRLTLPAGWQAQAAGAVTFGHVGAGDSVQARWQVTAPADAAPGPVTITSHASYAAGRWHRAVTGSSGLVVPEPSLAAAFNNTGISDDGAVNQANLDGGGWSYSEQQLTAAGLAPGAAVSAGGLSYTWPDVPAGQPDNVQADGQVINPGAPTGTAQIGFLGAGANSGTAGSQGNVTITYTDGSTDVVPLGFGGYALGFGGPVLFGNIVVATLPYRNNVDGTHQDAAMYVFAASVPVNPAKTVAAITLPTSVTVGQIHIFALSHN